MAHHLKPSFPSLLIFSVLLAVAGHRVSGREFPSNSGNSDKKQPQVFIDKSTGSYLVPGVGRFLLPPIGHHHHDHHHGFNPFTYNPVTGRNTGPGFRLPGDDSLKPGGAPRRQYIPGGDDTLVPNPGVEVPIPGRGGSNPGVAVPIPGRSGSVLPSYGGSPPEVPIP